MTLAIGVGLRIALPYALRPILESRASQALGARVDIADVDLALSRAGIALEDVAVRPAGWTPETDAGDPPLVAWKRLAVAVRWLPLFTKTIRLRELVLESPRVALDRLQDGHLNLLALAPAPAEPAAPAEEQPSSWGFGIDRLVLRDGGIRFRDLMVADAEPVELSLGSFDVEEIALSPAVYGAPARLRLQGRVDQGRFALDAGLAPRDDGGFALDARLKARRLPLARSRVYVPNVGWSELAGEVGGALHYLLETGGRNEVRGQITADGLAVHVPGLDTPGLAWKRLAVLVDPLDLAGRAAVVRHVELEGSYLVARARGGVVFPFIERVLTGEPADPAAAPPPPAAPVPEAPPWRWRVDRVTVWDSLLHVISPDASFDVGCTMGVRDLRSDPGEPGPVSIQLTLGDGGMLDIAGSTQIQPLGFDGTLKANGIALPDIVATAGVFPPGVLRRARFDADLGVTAGALAPSPGDVRLRGTIGFDEPYLAGAGGPTVEFGARRLAFGLGELLIPQGMPGQPLTAAAPNIRLGDGTVALEEPWAVRTDPTPFDVRAASLAATLDELTAPGVGPPPADGGALALRGSLEAAGVRLGNAGGSGLDVEIPEVDAGVGELVLPGILAIDPAQVTAPLRLAKATVTLAQPGAVGQGAQRLDARARGVTLSVGELLVPGGPGGPPGAVSVRSASLGVAQPRVVDTRAGTLDVRARGLDLAVDDLLAPAGGGSAGLLLRRGRVVLGEPVVTGRDAKEFAAGARAIGVGVDEFALPAAGPARVRLRDVTLGAPRLQVTRTADGLALPFGGDGAAPMPPHAPAPPPESAPAVASPPAAAPPAPAPGLDLAVASVRLTGGRVAVTDRTVKPAYTGAIDPLQIEIAGLRWPAGTVDRLRVEASSRKGKITVTGAVAAGGGKLQVDGKDIPLEQFNPYAVSLSPYRIRRGRLSLATSATFGAGKYDSETALTLHDFDLGSRAGDSLFKEQFGIPLSMALALLRDLDGDIKLDIPVDGDEHGMRIGYLTIIAGALRRALVNALASPLKLVGAVFSGDKVQAAPAPISFRTGRDVLTSEGETQVGQLAKFLADRPAMGVALATAPTETDVRWLRENDLLQELGAPQGVAGTLRNLTRRGVRDRITQALAARAEEEPGELDADDQRTLGEWLAERPAPPPDRLRALAGARLERVERALRERHGVAAARIVRREPAAVPTDATPPAVEVELGAVADLTAPPGAD